MPVHSTRRLVLRLAFVVGVASLSAAPAAHAADPDYPTRPIRIIHGYPAGGGADVIARQFVASLQAASGKTFVLENKPGNAGNVAIGLAATAKPDGYTMVIGSSSNMVGARFFYKDVTFDVFRDFVPLASFLEGTFVLVARNETPANSVDDLAKWLKSRPQNRFGFSNQLTQLAGEYYKSKTGVVAEPVAYKAATDAYPDLQNGLLEFMVADGTTSAGPVKNGKFKAIAVMTGERHPAFPGVPTMRELGYEDADFSTWWAMYMPVGVDPQIAATMEKWVLAATKDPALIKFMHESGNAPLHDDAKATRAHIERELGRWPPLVKAAGIQPQ
ncbi:tripartite tricarboxylate transporter substrate binding protein [Roseiarcaceae bacterium H3SJ34-1]|uniref:Bug family tripartite tricarboxylate transporter substrate binding protein n=1 Tax=Terripilifer ovatus TaxID=3032367 RepID=UPI003AB91ABC|nr:tripartite tricarboxylate transporter substrate binding protein [Roseiarcaceae bacterium H3SJ34-1]